MPKEQSITLELRAQILQSTYSQEFKNDLLAILDGERIAPLTSDIMAKRIFSPDLHPDRFDFMKCF